MLGGNFQPTCPMYGNLQCSRAQPEEAEGAGSSGPIYCNLCGTGETRRGVANQDYYPGTYSRRPRIQGRECIREQKVPGFWVAMRRGIMRSSSMLPRVLTLLPFFHRTWWGVTFHDRQDLIPPLPLARLHSPSSLPTFFSLETVHHESLPNTADGWESILLLTNAGTDHFPSAQSFS